YLPVVLFQSDLFHFLQSTLQFLLRFLRWIPPSLAHFLQLIRPLLLHSRLQSLLLPPFLQPIPWAWIHLPEARTSSSFLSEEICRLPKYCNILGFLEVLPCSIRCSTLLSIPCLLSGTGTQQ
ncbi:hypothetical protein PMAYCL1PPCAC_19036, partial [Pristionchus mayeri]